MAWMGGNDDLPLDSMAVVPGCALEYPSIDALSKVPQAPKFSFGSKPKRPNEKEAIPGPGSYFESSDQVFRCRKTAPTFSFGAATRKDLEKARVPGPGSYDSRSFLKKGGGFSLIPRRGKTLTTPHDDTPGPGSHDLARAEMGRRGPRVAMTPRRSDDAKIEERQRSAPGPGHYMPTEEVLSQAKAPKWSMGNGPRIVPPHKSIGSTPGPGAYRHDGLDDRPEAYRAIGQGPKWSMRARTANAKVGVLQQLYDG